MEYENLMAEEIARKVAGLELIKDSNDYEKAVKAIVAMSNVVHDSRKLELEMDEQSIRLDNEYDIKIKQLDETKKSRIVNIGLGVAGIVVPTVITVWGTIKTLKFEQTGTITSNMTRNFTSRLFKK